MTDSGPARIGISLDVKPHAYDPAANPELFEGVLPRRLVAFFIDVIVIMLPLIGAAIFIATVYPADQAQDQPRRGQQASQFNRVTHQS